MREEQIFNSRGASYYFINSGGPVRLTFPLEPKRPTFISLNGGKDHIYVSISWGLLHDCLTNSDEDNESCIRLCLSNCVTLGEGPMLHDSPH